MPDTLMIVPTLNQYKRYFLKFDKQVSLSATFSTEGGKEKKLSLLFMIEQMFHFVYIMVPEKWDHHREQYTFTFEQFGLSEVECLDVRFVAFVAGPKPGSFAFNIDHVALFS
jgi:hypothetical protein